MIKWYKDLYMDDKIRKKQNKYVQSIENGKVNLGLYCIALASNENNLFDIIDTNELFFRHYKRNLLYIVGLARGKENAIELAQELIMETYHQTGGFRVRDYFKFQ